MPPKSALSIAAEPASDMAALELLPMNSLRVVFFISVDLVLPGDS